MVGCAFQYDVRSVYVYCDGVGCHVLCLRHGVPVWQTLVKLSPLQAGRCLQATLNPNKLNKQINKQMQCT